MPSKHEYVYAGKNPCFHELLLSRWMWRICGVIPDSTGIHPWGFGSCCARPGTQSILTGESGSVAKFVDAVNTRKAVYQDKTCLLFSVRFLVHAQSSRVPYCHVIQPIQKGRRKMLC